MTSSLLIGLLIAVAFLAANLPWMSERVFLLVKVDRKRVWQRLSEWLLLYFLVGFLGLALEQKSIGSSHPQGWEFYAITFCLFMVFAFPGFIYRHDLHHIFTRKA